jgi:hypothetical protein
VAYSVKRGPLAGIEFASERQYRNAKRYLETHGTIPEPLQRARGYQAQVEKEHRLQQRSGMPPDDYARMRRYFAVRSAQREASDLDKQRRQHLSTTELEALNLAPKSEFLRYWDDAVRAGFTGPAMERLMMYAGMRDTGGKYKDRQHWELYRRTIEWFANNEPEQFTSEPWRKLHQIQRGKRKGHWVMPFEPDYRKYKKKKKE